jgi:serine/threonine protein kinase
MVTCPQCQTSYEDEVSFCIKDGSSLGAGSLDDECSTSISDAPPDLEDVLDLSEDLNAVEANADEIEEWQQDKIKSGHQVGSAESGESQAATEVEDEFEAAKGGTKSGDLAQGAFVGEYQIERKLAEGGMGVVYAAIQPLIGKRAAVKLLHRRFAKEKTVVDRFIQEARAVNTINHPNIVDIFSFGQTADSRHFFIMELLEGDDLARFLKKRGRLSVGEAIPILLQIALALQAAHDKGVVHRDLKPDNIHLLKGDPPKVKLLDFGVAKLLDNEKQAHMTNAGGLVGTPFYMSTEQCSGGTISAQTDLYALAILTYEMLAGTVPFPGNYFEVITSHLQKPPPPLPDDIDCASIKADLDAMLQKAMSKDPKDRQESVKVFVEELEQLAFGAGLYSPPVMASGAHVALKRVTGIQSAEQAAALTPTAHKPITTLSGSAAELKAREPRGTAKVVNPLVPIAPKPNFARRAVPFIGGVSLAVILAVVASFVIPKKPVEVAVPVQTVVKVDPVRIESSPPGADVFDKDNFLLGQTPFSVNPTKEKGVIVRWRGRFTTTIELADKKGTVTANPDVSGGAAKEPLLAQLENPALSLNKEVMAKMHEKHPGNFSKCEDCHANEFALDGALCQSCHKKGGPGATKSIANDTKQCITCHATGFKTSIKKYHIMGK